MPTTPAIIARDARLLAGASIRDLALAEAVDPAIVRRVLRAAGTPIPGRPALDAEVPAALVDPAWLRAEYATKAAGQIARELGCSRERVYTALHAAGIPMRQNRYYPNRSRRVDAELADRIVARYLAGAGARQIAAELGVSAQRVRKIVAARGVKRTRSEEAALRKAAPREHAARGAPAAAPSRWSPELEAVVLERYAAGESGEAIAAALGRSKRRVYRLLRERGVLRSPGRTRGTQDVRQASAEPAPEAPAPEDREILPAGLAEQVLARYAAGEAPRSMALALGVPASRIYRFLRERGVLRSRSEARTLSCALQWAGVARKQAEAAPAGRARKEEWPAELAAEVLARYEAGEPGPAIAAELGLKKGRVYALLRERGVVRTKSEAKRIGAKGRKAGG
jgi:DNA-binding CsgD family transcriptional regulator